MTDPNATSSRLHVVMAVANNTYPEDSRVRNEARALQGAGHQVSVIAPRGPDQPAWEVLDGIRAFRYTAPPRFRGAFGYLTEFAYVTMATGAFVLALMARRRVDVLHLHNPPDTLFLAALLPRLAGVKVVFDHHDLAPELYRAKFARPNAWLERGLRWLERRSSRFADRVVTVNESYRCETIRRNGVDPSSVVVVRNGPPLGRLEPVDPDVVARARAPALIGYLGHIARQDGVDHLIWALHHLDVEHGFRGWSALVIGPAEDPEPLHALARELGVADRIDFTGYRPDPVWRRLLAAVDVCVVPDPANGLNERSTMIKTMEYMALGKPVVAYDLHEHRVSAGEAALYAAPNDPRDLSAAMMRLLNDACLRERLGEVGRRRIREVLAWEYSAERLTALYATARSW